MDDEERRKHNEKSQKGNTEKYLIERFGETRPREVHSPNTNENFISLNSKIRNI